MCCVLSSCHVDGAFSGGLKRSIDLSMSRLYDDRMQQTYFFYDLETSGLSPAFDQVYQFAAIRTDLNFNEIERYEFLVKPTVDVIPAPEAMMTHRLAIPMLQEMGEAECDAIFKIHQLMNTPGTISLGYNTLSFDDEFLRFNFYRHLLTPYTHQFANQCRRMDLFPIVVFYRLFRPDLLEWEVREGKVSLKLEDLSRKNNLSVGQAHNAMVDVEATVALAKKLQTDPKMWNYLIEYFMKDKDALRLQELPLVAVGGVQYPTGIAVNAKFGAAQSFQVPVLGLGQHWHYANQSLWLKLDDERILSGDEALIPELWTLKKRCAEPPFILQPKERFNFIGDERKKLAEETLRFLQLNPQFFKALQDYALDFKFPIYKETDIDAALYMNGFWSNEESAAMSRFWQSSGADKAKQAEGYRSPKLHSLAQRFIGRFYREELTEAEESLFADYLKKIWDQEESSIVDYQLNPRLTRGAALKRIAEIDQANLDAQQKEVLSGVKAYLS